MEAGGMAYTNNPARGRDSRDRAAGLPQGVSEHCEGRSLEREEMETDGEGDQLGVVEWERKRADNVDGGKERAFRLREGWTKRD